LNRKQFLASSLFSLLASKLKAANFEMVTIQTTDLITLNYCIGGVQAYYFDFSPYDVNWYAVLDSELPTNMEVVEDAATGNAVGILIDTATASSLNDVNFQINLGAFDVEYITDIVIRVNVLASCETASDVCCTNAEQIVWINRDGGLQNFYFDGVREFNIDQRDDEEYVDSGNTSRYSTSGKVKDGRIFSTKNITKTELNALDSLNYSIQAWHLSGYEYLPISIAKGGYTKYNSRDRRFNASIRFTYSTPINIQTQ
jgi:hypothetical protein